MRVHWLGLVLIGSCGTTTSDTTSASDDPKPDGDESTLECAADNGGIDLPEGFCATVFADNLGRARHLAVTPHGDVFVAIAPVPDDPDDPGKVIALRDDDRDGIAEIQDEVIDFGGNGIAWSDDALFVAPDDRIVRFEAPVGSLSPERPQVIVRDLPATPDHAAKTVVVAGSDLYVNIGSASNSCQVENRVLHSPGIDPCTELETRAGIWRFDTDDLDQCQNIDGGRFATGLRNTNALTYDAQTEALIGAVNGRDQLGENWPELFTPEQDLQLPAEEIVIIREGQDYGWPYCYYDPFQRMKVLAPEYGGDGTIVGRCEDKEVPEATLPAHWAPLGIVSYRARSFPAAWRDGVFIANHGSRFDMEGMFDPGYNVVFVPFEPGAQGGLSTEWVEFAGGFDAGMLPLPDAAPYRPVGLAVMPDGSLLISDDKVGRIWRVTAQIAGED